MWTEKNGPTWRIRDLVNGKKVVVDSGFPTRAAANKMKTILEADKLQGRFIDPQAGKVLLSTWADTWWRTHRTGLKPSAVKSEGSRLRTHIVPMLGHLALADITPLTVAEFVAELTDPTDGRKPLAPKTARNVHGLLYSLMRGAVVARAIGLNPCEDTKLPEITPKEMRFLTEPELGRLLTRIPHHWQPLTLVLAATGMRWGEAAALHVRHVDVLARTLRIERTLHWLPGTGFTETTPKSKMSRRTVTVPADVADVLIPLVANRDRDEYVFTTTHGNAIRYKVWWDIWTTALAESEFAGFGAHGLRHTHAAALISEGVPLTAVQRRLGHTSIQVTSDLYGHLLPQVDQGIIEATEKSLQRIDFRGILGETVPNQPVPTRTRSGKKAGQAT